MNGRLPLFVSPLGRVAPFAINSFAIALLTLSFASSTQAQLPIAPAPDGTVVARHCQAGDPRIDDQELAGIELAILPLRGRDEQLIE